MDGANTATRQHDNTTTRQHEQHTVFKMGVSDGIAQLALACGDPLCGLHSSCNEDGILQCVWLILLELVLLSTSWTSYMDGSLG